ncbi:MAG: FixH family protein [Halocynthiibacter sp.]
MKPFTGRKVFAFIASAFGLVIGVNLFMAYSAISTYPGLEVDNTFVANQNFDADRAAQIALGWDVSARVQAGVLSLTILDNEGQAAEVGTLRVTVGRPTQARDDITPEFERSGGIYTAPIDIAPGNWNLRIDATAPDGTSFRQRIVLLVKG